MNDPKPSADTVGQRSAPPSGSAIVRRCDVCGKINAIDLDWSEEHERDLQLPDHSVLRVHESEALELWKRAGRCDHKKLIEQLQAQLASPNAEITDRR